MIVKINRGSVERPAMPNIDAQPAIDTNTVGGFDSLSKDDKVAYLVNKGLDGDMDAVNSCEDKIIGKSKRTIVKINRGSVERPAMPNIGAPAEAKSPSNEESESDEQKIKRLTAKGLEGDMDEINALDNKVIRGKIKAAIVKANVRPNKSDPSKTLLTKTQVISMVACTILFVVYITLVTWYF